MSLCKKVAVAGAAMLLTAGTGCAADLEFYFPIGVNARVQSVIEELTQGWEAENPGNTVKPIYAGNYTDTRTKALTALAAGDPPHVVIMQSIDIFTLVEEEAIIAISDVATTPEDQEWFDGFYDAFMLDSEFEGKVYGIPFQRSTPVYYYNKDAFREVGLDPETPPATWEDLIETGKKLVVKDANGNVTRWAARYPTGTWTLTSLAISNGQAHSDGTGTKAFLDTPASVGGLEFLLRMSEEGIMQPGFISWGETPKAFLDGNTAAMWTSTGNLAFVRDNAEFDWGVGFLPGGKGPGAATGGGNLYIMNGITEEEQKASLSLIKYMSRPDNAAKWTIATGYIAPRPEVWETDVMKDYTADLPQALVARDQLKYAGREFATFQRGLVSSFLQEAMDAALQGDKTPAEALADAQRKADQVLGDYN